MGIDKLSWDNCKKSIFQKLSDRKRELTWILKWDEWEGTEIKSELYWNADAILRDLKENCVKVEENVEMMWYKWKKVKINLPKIKWKFEWKVFEYFVSEERMRSKSLENNSELRSKSYSMKEVWELLRAINRYMKVYGVKTDRRKKYEDFLIPWVFNRSLRSEAWECLKYITNLDSCYWLQDKSGKSVVKRNIYWFCVDDYCYFNADTSKLWAHLFLKSS